MAQSVRHSHVFPARTVIIQRMMCSRCGFKLPKDFPSDICDACYDTEILLEADGYTRGFDSLLLEPLSRINSLFLLEV
jgi:hypothetical protein